MFLVLYLLQAVHDKLFWFMSLRSPQKVFGARPAQLALLQRS
jgi:hypothetical protein